MPSPDFRAGLLAALPIMLGYAPIAFAFGVAATGAGLSGPETFALSLFIYAGASQFLAIALITGGSPLVVAAVTLMAMNLRHVLYAPALLKAAGPDAATRSARVWAWGLTDEVFGAAMGRLAQGGRFSERYMTGLGAGAYASWLVGTAAGAAAGGGALAGYPALQAGLGFLLPALFLALLLSILTRRQLPVVAVAGVVCAGVALAWSPTAGILCGMLTGAAAGILGPRP